MKNIYQNFYRIMIFNASALYKVTGQTHYIFYYPTPVFILFI